MKNYFLSLAILFFIGCTNSSQDKSTYAAAEESPNVEAIDVVDLLVNAKDYDGKEVIITGTATHVCKHSGKRLHLMGKDDKTKIRVEAGEIGQFERELEGSDIVAKGIFRREIIDEDYLAKWENEMKKEGGEHHKSHEEQEEEEGRMKRYREMMKKAEGGYMEQFWVDGISFHTVEEDASI